MTRVDRAARTIKAPPSAVYRALIDAELILGWLPPEGARGAIDAFDPRPGGAFCITLTFEHAPGKSSSDTDVVEGRFVALAPDRRVVQQFAFSSPDPAFAGTMTMTWTLAPHDDGTRLVVTAEDVPAGIAPQDHEAGMASSLANLAALLEGER